MALKNSRVKLKSTVNIGKTKKNMLLKGIYLNTYFNLKHLLHYIYYYIIAIVNVDYILFDLDLYFNILTC